MDALRTREDLGASHVEVVAVAVLSCWVLGGGRGRGGGWRRGGGGHGVEGADGERVLV